MRIASLQPTATEILVGLGLADSVVAVSHECELKRPVVVRSRVDSPALAVVEIDRQVRDISARGESLYEIDLQRLRELAPDLIFVQSVCEVCAVAPSNVLPLLKQLPGSPRLITFHTHSIEDALSDILRIGTETGSEPRARAWVASLRSRLQSIQKATQDLARPRVFCVEWFDPVFATGHWVPEMVAIAGGRELFGRAGEESRTVPWEEVVQAAPERIVCMPCGIPMERAMKDLTQLTSRPGWNDLPAVKGGHVYVTNGSAYFNGAGPRLVDGVEILAEIIHPGVFSGRGDPNGFRRV